MPFENRKNNYTITDKSRTDAVITPLGDVQRRLEILERRLDKGVADFDKKIGEKETRTTEVLAIFITLFTFISTGFTIFNRIDNVQTGAWFIILITVCAILLLASMFILINRSRGPYSIIFVALSLSILVGCMIYLTLVPDVSLRLNNIVVSDRP